MSNPLFNRRWYFNCFQQWYWKGSTVRRFEIDIVQLHFHKAPRQVELKAALLGFCLRLNYDGWGRR